MIGWKVIPQTVYGLLGLSLRKNNIIHSLPHVLLAGPLAYCWSWSSLEKGAGHDGRGHAVRSFFVWAFYGSVCPVGPVFSTLSGLCPGFVQACVFCFRPCPHLYVHICVLALSALSYALFGPCPPAWPRCFPVLHRLVWVGFLVALNATVIHAAFQV